MFYSLFIEYATNTFNSDIPQFCQRLKMDDLTELILTCLINSKLFLFLRLLFLGIKYSCIINSEVL